MPHFRNVNSGQSVTHEDADLVAKFRSWSRWEEIDAPEVKAEVKKAPAKKAPAKKPAAPADDKQ